MAKKQKAKAEAQEPEWDGLVDTLQVLASKRIVVLTYDPATDCVTIDATGCSPMERRSIIAEAQDVMDTFADYEDS